MEKAYRNLGYFFALLIPLTLLGFYKTYFNQFPSFEETPSPFIHLHAVIASIWIIMLIGQPFLIRNRKLALHKQIGRVSFFVFPLLVLSFVPQMIRLYHSDMPENLFFPLSDCIALTLFYLLAIFYKRNAGKHMRYMIGTAIVFLGPTFGRIGIFVLGLSDVLTQNLQYTLIYLIVIALIFLDQKNRKNYRPYLVILAVYVVHQIAFNLVF